MRRAISSFSALLFWPTMAFANNPANDILLHRSQTEQLYFLGVVVGDGCQARSVYYMGIGEKEGLAKDAAFWGILCSDGRTFAVTINPDKQGSTGVIDCPTSSAVAHQSCFEPLKQ